MSLFSSSSNLKNKVRYFTFYKYGAIISLILAGIFLLVGVSQSVKGPSQTENLKTDFSNLSKDKAVSITLEQASDLGVEYVARSGRRSTTTYNYFLIKTQGKKLILETKDRENIKTGAKIDIKNQIAGITAQNQDNLKALSQKNIADENLRPTTGELAEIKIVSHLTSSDKFAADYWGWIAFLIFLVSAGVLGIRYWWDKRNYKIAFEDAKESFAPQSTSNTQNNFSNLAQTQTSTTASFLPTTAAISTNNIESTKPDLSEQTVHQPVYNSTTKKPKTNKTTYIVLAIFLGIFGVHHFYSQKIVFGLLHLTWLACFVIPLFAIDRLALIFLLSFILLPITFVVSLVQALVKTTFKE